MCGLLARTRRGRVDIRWEVGVVGREFERTLGGAAVPVTNATRAAPEDPSRKASR